MKPGNPPLQSVRLLDQMRERIRYMHYSLSTEKVYLYWVRFFIRWSGHGGPMRHPRDMGAPEVEAFLSMLATERKVSASTHNQALSAVLFLYREVLNINLPWLNDINRPSHKRRIPSVLTKDEVAGVLAQMGGQTALLARLLYGTGMHLQMLAARAQTGRGADWHCQAGLGAHAAPLIRHPGSHHPRPPHALGASTTSAAERNASTAAGRPQ